MTKRPAFERMAIWAIVLLAVAVPGLYVASGLFIRFVMVPSFESPSKAVVPSPAEGVGEVWLVRRGFTDPYVALCARTPAIASGVPVKILEIDDGVSYAFEHLRWSKDGKVVVATVNLDRDPSAEPVAACAVNFATGEVLLPEWQQSEWVEERPLEDWRAFEAQVDRVIEVHGGLDDEVFGYAEMREQLKEMPYWSEYNKLEWYSAPTD